MRKTAQRKIDNINHKIYIINGLKITDNICFIINNRARRGGFTLIELLVAISILATLAGGILLTLNPFEQINKSVDAQRMADLQEIKTALELYYHDTGCYPSESTGIPFGNEWRVDNTIYFKKTPQDPRASDEEERSYRYRTSNDTCPQWSVLFAELSRDSTAVDACPLSSLSNCLPEGYEEGRFACTLSGGVDCTNLLASSLLGGIETVGNTPTPGPPTPTPIPDPFEQGIPLIEEIFPDPEEIILNHGANNFRGSPGAAQLVKVEIEDQGVEVTSVEVIFTHDTGQRSLFLNPPSGSPNNTGIWQAASQVGALETYCNLYSIEVVTTSENAQGVETVSYEGINLISTGLIGGCE